jgi:hypothetical protein
MPAFDQNLKTPWSPEPTADWVKEVLRGPNGGPEAMTAVQTAAFLAISLEEVARRQKAKEILGLPDQEFSLLYPVWQFDLSQSDSLIPDLALILAITPPADVWSLADTLTSRQPALGDRTPLEALAAQPRQLESLETLLAILADRYNLPLAEMASALTPWRAQLGDYWKFLAGQIKNP